MRARLARLGNARLPRDLHPVAWWVWALGLATAASFTTNPYILLLLIGVACVTVAARRSAQPWADSFRLYLWLGFAIVVIRVLFRVLLGGGDGGEVLLDLPEIPLPHWTLGLRLLGPVTRESLLAGLYDGLRLAAIVICVGSANALANPKRLLRSVPPALYEVGSALVVAVTVLPQLADSVRRVRAAQTLRGGDTGRVRGLRRVLVPVLEDSLERSLALAAGMDTRGYGRSSGATARERRTTGALMLLGLVRRLRRGVRRARPHDAGLGRPPDARRSGWLVSFVAVRARRAAGRPHPLPAGPRGAGRRWSWRASGVVVGAAGWWMSQHQLTVAYPSLTVAPTLSLVALAAVGVGPRRRLCAAASGPPSRGEVPRDRAARHRLRLRRPAGPAATSTCTIDEGELVVVSGRTGVGKSTLLGVVTGLVPRFTGGTLSGDVLVDGRSVVHAAAARARPSSSGTSARTPRPGSSPTRVEEELAYGMEQLGLPADTMRRRVEETLDLLGIADAACP